jgi:hypothetical protein
MVPVQIYPGPRTMCVMAPGYPRYICESLYELRLSLCERPPFFGSELRPLPGSILTSETYSPCEQDAIPDSPEYWNRNARELWCVNLSHGDVQYIECLVTHDIVSAATYVDPETGFTFNHNIVQTSLSSSLTVRIAIPSTASPGSAYGAVIQVVAPLNTGWVGSHLGRPNALQPINCRLG